ncbi:MAG: helix-turn-helix domain-containing protein [Lachnospiraceae bacterium]
MFPLINKRETGVNLRRIMDMRGITPKDVQEYLGLGCVQSVYRWTDGVNMPTIDNLYALSELLQVPIDVIVCGNRVPTAPNIIIRKMDSRESRLCAYYEKLQEKRAA